MASQRRVRPLPVPGADLARLRETLHPHYGSTLHESEAERVLIVRVPRDDPDMVNDVEQCIEYLNPAELQEASTCLLVGHQKTLQFPPQPMRDLMAARIQFDRRQCHLLRNQLKPGEHRLFKAPEDPRRIVRLAVRFARPRVADLQEEDLLEAARAIGPKAKTSAYKDVRSVYLVADKDDVRMDADLFFQDVQARWTEEEERGRLAQEIVRKETARRLQSEAERQARVAALPPPPSRLAVAPLKSHTAAQWEDPSKATMYERLDALLGISPARPSHGTIPTRPSPIAESTQEIGVPETPPEPASDIPSSRPASPEPATPPSEQTAQPAPLPQHLPALQAALVASGFEVLVRPGTHGIDLAAERADFPSRIIAYCPDRLDVAFADRAITSAKALGVDFCIVTCSDVEPEARKRIIATKVRWVDPVALPEYRL